MILFLAQFYHILDAGQLHWSAQGGDVCPRHHMMEQVPGRDLHAAN